MLEQYVRPCLQRWLFDPLIQLCAKHTSITPKRLTICALLTGLAAASCVILDLRWLAILLLIASGLFDVLDGSLARFQSCAEPVGAVLDIVTDRCVEIAMVLGLYFLSPETRGTASLLMLASILLCVTTFLVVGIFTDNQSDKSFHYSPGLMERAEAFLFFIAMVVWPNSFVGLAALFTGLVLLTALQRLRAFLAWQLRVQTDAAQAPPV